MDSLESLVLKAQAGDAGAYNVIFERFKGMALSYAYSILGDYELAEDAKQEAFVGAYCDLLALRNPAAFPGWFRTIVRKHSIQIKRGQKGLMLPLEDASHVASEDPDPADLTEKSEASERISRSIAQLPEHEREVTRLFYLQGLSLKEIARLIDLPEKTVKSRLFSARARLRQRLMGMVKDSIRKDHLAGADKAKRDASKEAIHAFDEDLTSLLKVPTAEDYRTAAKLICAKARLLRFMGETDSALQSLTDALSLPGLKKDISIQVRFKAEIGLTCVQLSDYPRARKEFLYCRNHLGKDLQDLALLAVVDNGLGMCFWGEGRPADARKCYQDTIELSRKSRSPVLEAEATNNLALLDWRNGFLEKALQGFQHSLKIWRAVRNRFGQALTLMNIGIIEENMGRFMQARRHYERSLDLAREVNYLQVQSAVACNLSNLNLIHQEWETAETYAREAQALARKIRDRRSEAIAIENLAAAQAGLTHYAEAIRSLRKARKIAEDIGDAERLGTLELSEAEFLIGKSEYGKAKNHLESASKVLRQTGNSVEFPRILRLQAIMKYESGSPEEAVELAREALAEARKQKNRVEEKRIARMVGRIGVKI